MAATPLRMSLTPPRVGAATAPTLVLAPPACLRHRTAPEPILRGGPDVPPENVRRLIVLTDPGVLLTFSCFFVNDRMKLAHYFYLYHEATTAVSVNYAHSPFY